ncbi:hypothetical protein BC828DRAFT_394311 [Blastocladiella britannica]|nr:hypothetical protein BC828DRAFT_394311 [Blastocladiella britannica]
MTSLHHGDIAAVVLALAASQSQSLTQGIVFLRVLPAIEQPDTRTFILVRGYIDPVVAVALGHADLLPEFPKWQLLDTRGNIVRALAASGNVVALSAFIARHAGAIEHGPMATDALDNSTIIHAALSSGHVHVLEWLVATAAEREWAVDWNRGTWDNAAAAGHMSVLDWALRKGYFGTHGENQTSAESVYSIDIAKGIPRAASEGCHVNVLDWWWATIVPLISSPPALPPVDEWDTIISQALFSGNLDVVRWWWAKFEAYRAPGDLFGSRMAAYNALASGSLPVIQWLWAIAARPHTCQFLDEWDPRPVTTLPSGPFSKSLPLVQWVASQLPRGQPLAWKPHNTLICARSGAVDVLDWVLALPDRSRVEWGDVLVSMAVGYRQLHVMEWYLKHLVQLPEQQPPMAHFNDFEDEDHGIDAIAWWETHFGFVDASFVRLGVDIVQYRDSDWLEWWLFQLAKPTRSHLVPSALTRALISARTAWALDMLASTAAAEYGLDVLHLVAKHACLRSASTIEAVCWWYVVLGGVAAKFKWQSQPYGGSARCRGCWLSEQEEI